MLIGWWQPNEGMPDVIIDNHPAVLDYALFAEGYARLKGYTLEGDPVENYRGVTRIRETRETSPDLLFHGRLILTPPSADEKAYITINENLSKLYYQGVCRRINSMDRSKWCSIPGAEFDSIVIERLLALERADIDMKNRVRTTLEQVYHQRSEDFISIPQQMEGIQNQLLENAKKRMRTSVDDPMYDLLEEEKRDLMERQGVLEAKKEKLGLVDSTEDINRLHRLLGDFEAVWPTFDLAQRQRAFSLLVNRIEVEVISPHWIRLSIGWLDAVCPRLDVAYLWKAVPGRGGKLSDEEKDFLRQHYPRSPRLEFLKRMPDRSWQTLQQVASVMGLKRKLYLNEDLHPSACYRDLFPKLDGHYLLKDYETTLAYINTASRNTAKGKAPLYALWLLSETVEDMAALLQWDLEEKDHACSSTSLRTSAGCAPETPYFSSIAKNGTP